MKSILLLDTCVLLDTLFKYQTLSQEAKKWMEDGHHSLAVSAASIWEVSIKNFKHPKDMQIDGSTLYHLLKQLDISIIPIKPEHTQAIGPILQEGIHNDPFDTIIVATAAVDCYTLLTKDEKLAKYRNANIVLV